MTEQTTEQEDINIYNAVLGAQPTAAEIAAYKGKEFKTVFGDVFAYAIKNQVDYMLFKRESGQNKADADNWRAYKKLSKELSS